jgi:hypothetical protein
VKYRVEGTLWLVSFVSLIVAALTTTRACLLVIAIVWLLSSVTVIPLHFYKAWRRRREAPNEREYAAWVGFETLATIAFVGLFIYSVSSR